MKPFYFLFYIFFFAVAFLSCVKDKVDFDKTSNTVFWNPALGIPLTHSTILMKEMMETLGSKGLIGEYPDGGLYLTYSKNLLSQTGAVKNKIDNQGFLYNINSTSLKIPAIPAGATSTIIPIDSLQLKIDNTTQIDSLYFKTGKITITTSSTFPKPCSITISFPTIFKNGVSISSVLTYSGSAKSTDNIDLSACKMLLVNKKIPIKAVISFNIATTQLLTGTENLSFNFEISNATFSRMYGYLGNIQLLNDTTANNKLLLFSDKNTTGVEIANPNINIIIKNSYGVPIQLKLDSTRTFSAATNSYFDLRFYSSTNNVNPHNIKFPSLTQIGQKAFDTISYNNTNCNIDSVMTTSPQFFYYGIKAKCNPSGRTATPNYITDTSKLSVDVQIEVPLNLKAKSLVLSDTIALDFGSSVSDFSILKKMAIYTTFNSYMPFDIKLQVYLVDENNILIDSLFDASTQPIVKSAIIDVTTGKIINPVKKLSGSVFESTRAKNFQKVKKGIIKADLATYNNGSTFVKITTDFKLEVVFQVQTELQIKNLNQL